MADVGHVNVEAAKPVASPVSVMESNDTCSSSARFRGDVLDTLDITFTAKETHTK